MIDVVLIAVIAGALASLLNAASIGDRSLETVSKTAASLGFVALGAAGMGRGDPVAAWLVGGLALCALGDVLLISDRSFDAGVIAFLLGHVAYIVAFHQARPMADWDLRLAAPPALVGFAAEVWLWPHLGSRRPAVTAYIVVISTMVWGALTAAPVLGAALTVGAVLFFLSDLAVARQRFVTPEFLNRAVGLPMYYAGQVLVALSV
jgi:uncharacterized membrane protein YhhN